MADINEVANEFFDKYEKDPVAFVKEILGDNLWSKQVEIFESLRDNQQTVVQSGYATGKSFSLARAALWYAYTHVPSKIVCTSSSWSQVEKIIFAELAAAHANSIVPLGGKLMSTELQIHKDWFIVGVSPQINVDQEAYRAEGYHSPNVLVLMDQAQGIDPKLWDVCVSLVTGETSRILVMGNPTSPSGRYYDACRSEKWHKIKIPASEVPNVKEGTEIIPGLVSRQWIENRKDDWGENNPLFITKVLAEFPAEADNILIPLTIAEKALNNKVLAEGVKGLGVDVARFGNAYTVLTCVLGDKVVEILAYRGQDTMKTAGQVKRLMTKYQIPDFAVCIDDSGVGGGVVDRLHEEGHRVVGVNNGSRANDPEHYANLSAELHWDLRNRFLRGKIQIPNEPILLSQLSGRKYSLDSKGRIKIESKDELQKRGLKSPDHADSLVLASYAQKLFGGSGSGSYLTVLGVDDDELVL